MKKLKTGLRVISLSLLMLLTFSLNVNAQNFSDLPTKHWAYKAVNEMTEKGVVSGYTDGTFKPSNHVTRAEFAKLIVTTLGLDEEKNTNPMIFADVKEGTWAYEYVKQAGNYLAGVNSSGKLNFNPNKDAVREDMAVAVVTASGLANADYNKATLNKFSDISKASEGAKKYIAIAVEHGLMKGNANGTFNPKGTLTRAEAAQLMLNYNKSTKVSPADLDKNKKSDDTKPVLFEKYGYIDLGTNFSKYEYSDNGTWYKATDRYIHKSSNKSSGTCNNVYYTDVQIREANNKNVTYSFKIPFVSLIRPEYNKSSGTVDLGENWHAYDILTTNEEELKKGSGSYKWVKAPDRYIKKGEEYFDKEYLFVRYEEKDKSSFTSEVFKISNGANGLTWKETSKTIEWKNTGYKITTEDGKTYLTVGTGARSTSGYSIAITNVSISGYNITITTQETVPAKGANVTKGSYYPTYTIELSTRPDKVTVKKLANKTADRDALTWQKTSKQIEYKSSGYKITQEDGKTYLTVGTGSRSTSGYSIEITNVEINGFTVTVTTQETVPGKGASTTKGTNYPSATIELSGKPDKVTIKKLENKAEGGQALSWKETSKQIEYKSSGYKITQEDGKTYLTVGLGSRTTTGYSIAIVDVEISGYEMIVTTQETAPGKGVAVTKQTNYPSTTIELSAKPDKVTLKKLDKITAASVPLTWQRTNKQIEYKSSGYKITEEDGKVYLTVGTGARQTSGYSIAITNVAINDYTVTVSTQETVPGRGVTVTKGTNYPSATIELSAKPDKVTIQKLENISSDGVPLTWKETTKQIEHKNSGYKITQENGKTYLTVGLGPRDTTGYTVAITNVSISGYNVTVTIQESTPSKDDKVEKKTTYPSATIELSDKPDKVTVNKADVKYGGVDPLTWKHVDIDLPYRATSYRVTHKDGKIYLQYGLGECKTEGYSIEITNVQVKGNDITVSVQETRPGKGKMLPEKINYPYATIELSEEPGDIKINILPVKYGESELLTWVESPRDVFSCTKADYVVNEKDGLVYLTIGLGKRTTTGYTLEVTDVSIKGYDVTVTVQENTPYKGCIKVSGQWYPQKEIIFTARPENITVKRLDKKVGDRPPLTWKESNEVITYKQKGYKLTTISQVGNMKELLTVGLGARKEMDYTVKIEDVKFDGYNVTVYAQEYTPPADKHYAFTVYPTATIELNAIPDKVTVEWLTPIETPVDTSLKITSSNKKFPFTEEGYRIEEADGKIYLVIGVGNKPYQFTLSRDTEITKGDTVTITTDESVSRSNKVGGSWNSTVTYEVNKIPDKVNWTHNSYQLDPPTSEFEWSAINAPNGSFPDTGGYQVRQENDYWVVTICPGKFKNWQYFLVFDATRDGDKLIINCVRDEGSSTGPNYAQSTSIKVNFKPTSVITNWIVH